ncbi:CBN-SRBC-40 protein [Caenorhabditis brenneri]|uniref:CBN-SRBC-40 protein n=1 Tax=Caenorhabditis brenneri TaxID=135651 RepID=G0NEI5_CAEBE|nr:CBN-SRBC-40 protein [Caenorhabditis brenneri]
MMLPLIVSSIGVVCGILIAIINCYLILMFRCQRHHQTHDMTQFFYRFHLDVIIGVATCLYLGHVLTYYLFPDFFESTRLLVLWFGLLTSNLQMARMMFQLFISCDRVMAAFFPIEYRVYHAKIPIWPFFIFALVSGFFHDFIFFYCCDFVIYVPKNCLALGCVMNVCFKTFWSAYQTVILSAIVLLSAAFCIRLFLWSKSASSLTQANRLAVLDAVVTFFCQFIPPFCVSLWPDFPLFQFSYAGPFNLVGKLVGNSIESFLMLRLLRKRYTEDKLTTTLAVRGLSHATHSSDHHKY